MCAQAILEGLCQCVHVGKLMLFFFLYKYCCPVMDLSGSVQLGICSRGRWRWKLFSLGCS